MVTETQNAQHVPTTHESVYSDLRACRPTMYCAGAQHTAVARHARPDLPRAGPVKHSGETNPVGPAGKKK